MSEFREITIEVEIDVESAVDAIKSSIEEALSVSWDLSASTITQKRTIEVPVADVEEDGTFNDPLTEESVLGNEQESANDQFKEALRVAIFNL